MAVGNIELRSSARTVRSLNLWPISPALIFTYAFGSQEGATSPGAGARLLQATVWVGALEEHPCSPVYVCVFACGFVCMRAVPTEARKECQIS